MPWSGYHIPSNFSPFLQTDVPRPFSSAQGTEGLFAPPFLHPEGALGPPSRRVQGKERIHRPKTSAEMKRAGSSGLPSPAPGAKWGHLAQATGEGTANGGCLHSPEHTQRYQIWLWKITNQQWLIRSSFHYNKLPDRDPGNA